MVEADFEVIGELREIGLKFPAKLPAGKIQNKQTVGRAMRDSNGQFGKGNTFAAGYGAPVGNQNARGARGASEKHQCRQDG